MKKCDIVVGQRVRYRYYDDDHWQNQDGTVIEVAELPVIKWDDYADVEVMLPFWLDILDGKPM